MDLKIYAGFFFALTLTAIAAIEVKAEAATLGGLRLERDVQLEKLNEPLKVFGEKYKAGLNRLKEKAQAAGNLDEALAIADELKNFQDSEPELSKIYPELAALQKIYREGSAPLLSKIEGQRVEIFTNYDKRLSMLETSLTRSGNLEEAIEVKKEREVASALLSKMLSDRAKAGGLILEEEFDEPLDPEKWFVSDDIQVREGHLFANSYSDDTRIEILEKISGDFEIEVDLIREGEHTWQFWDCSIKLTAASPAAAIRLARDDLNLLYVDASTGRNGKPGNPADDGIIQVTQRGRDSEGGIFTVQFKDGQFIASFIDRKGKEMICEPVSIPPFEETGIVIRFGGMPETPRKIERVSVKRPKSSED